MSTAAVEERLTKLWERPKTVRGWFATVDHKDLGIRYIVTAFVFLLVGGVEALLMRLQLSGPEQTVLSPEMYDQIFSMHGITMIFWYAAPILSGFAVYLVPLMIGARDMAFPRLNAFTYWAYLLSGILLYIAPAIGQAPHGGWFAYMPYTGVQFSPSYGLDFYALSLIFLTISTTGGAVNFIVTILRLRAPGMTISRMPLFLYSTLTISFAILLALPALTVACVFMELDRRWGTHFFQIGNGGDPILWQQLFWFFGHPWVYVIFLPATGMLSMIVPVFSRRPIVGHPYIAISTILTGAVGFGVWLHHMFTIGMSDMAMSFFSAGSMTISIFTTVQVFAWVATIWKGSPVLTSAMLYATGAIALLVIGGLNGVFTGIIPVDWQVHNTYYVVAHIHYVIVGSNMFPVFAAIYYWGPKMTGRMLNESLGKLSFWVMFLGFNLAFFPMHILGLMGMPRRIYTYAAGLGFGPMNMLVTIGGFILGLGILITVINLWVSMQSGTIAGRNPWNSDGLEWETDSPPKAYATVHIPIVVSRHPLWDENDEAYDPENERVLDQARMTPTTTVLDAEPAGIATIPGDTLAPLLASITMFVLFIALIFQFLWIALAAFLATFALCGLLAVAIYPGDRLMGALAGSPPKDRARACNLTSLPIDDRRGIQGMWCVLLTEMSLFVCLFAAYFYLGIDKNRWSADQPPKLVYALVMLVVLLSSSVVLEWGERQVSRERYRAARVSLIVTICIGLMFMVLQVLEYRDHWKTLTPYSDSYGSIFYALTTFHAAHVIAGLMFLSYVAFLPRYGPLAAPFRPYKVVSLYWHFVDIVWIFIVLILYVIPHFTAHA